MPVTWGAARRPILDDRFLGAVLAGGESSRFGSPKPRAEVEGHTMAERAFVTLRAVCAEVVALSDDREAFEPLGVRLVADAPAGIGPLGGLRAALLHARERGLDGALVLAADLPFVPAEALRILVTHANTSSAQAVALEDQPLCALYRLEALPRIEQRIAAGEHAMRGLLEALPHEIVTIAELRAAGIPERALLNVNRPEDLPDPADADPQ